MNAEKVRDLFQIMAQITEIQPYDALIGCAMEEVEDALRKDCETLPPRLEFLAAAIANVYYREIQAAHTQPACTYAGTVAQPADYSKQLQAAQQLAEHYRQVCSPWLKDTAFCFFLTGRPREEMLTHDTNPVGTAASTDGTVADGGLYGV